MTHQIFTEIQSDRIKILDKKFLDKNPRIAWGKHPLSNSIAHRYIRHMCDKLDIDISDGYLTRDIFNARRNDVVQYGIDNQQRQFIIPLLFIQLDITPRVSHIDTLERMITRPGSEISRNINKYINFFRGNWYKFANGNKMFLKTSDIRYTPIDINEDKMYYLIKSHKSLIVS